MQTSGVPGGQELVQDLQGIGKRIHSSRADVVDLELLKADGFMEVRSLLSTVQAAESFPCCPTLSLNRSTLSESMQSLGFHLILPMGLHRVLWPSLLSWCLIKQGWGLSPTVNKNRLPQKGNRLFPLCPQSNCRPISEVVRPTIPSAAGGEWSSEHCPSPPGVKAARPLLSGKARISLGRNERNMEDSRGHQTD